MMQAVIEAPWELWPKQRDHHLPVAVTCVRRPRSTQLVSHSTTFFFTENGSRAIRRTFTCLHPP
jgi:hypothetical protein